MVDISRKNNPTWGLDVSKYIRMDDIRLTDISISTLDGTNISIMNQYALIEITEDLFQNCMHGVCSLIDASNLVSNFPITGQEFITISFNTPSVDKEVELVFLIDKISSRASLKNKQSQIYDIHFVSPLLMLNMVNTVSKAYTNKTISDMVEDIHHSYILQDNGKTMSTREDREMNIVTTDYTDGSTNIIIPHWNPLTAINWLSKRASSTNNPKVCDYVYYQDVDGFHFRSIRELFKKDISQVYLYGVDNANDMVRDHISKPIDVDASLSNIRKMVIGAFDRSKEVHRGTYSSSLLIHDIITKSYTVSEYNYLEEFDELPSLNENPILSRNTNIYNQRPEAKTFFAPTHTNLYGEPSGAKLNSGNDGIEEWLTRHDAQVEQLKSSSLIIEVAGDSTRRVGDVVHILINSFQGEDQDGAVNVDNVLSGKYLITSINHQISKIKGHTLRMKVCKESNEERSPDSLSIEQEKSVTNTNSDIDGLLS